MSQTRTDLITDSAGTGTPDFSQGLSISKDAASPPVVDTIYKDNICRAWINFNGTGTIAIRDSFNVSGITDNNVGLYTVTLDTDFANNDYAIAPGLGIQAIRSLGTNINIFNLLVGSFQLSIANSVNVAADYDTTTVIAFGDQI